MNDKEPYLDVDEAAKYLQLHSETVRRMAREKNLPAVKIGRSWRFKVSTLDEWINKNALVMDAHSELPPQGPKKILCVDDDPDVLVFLKSVLGNNGFTVVTAQTGHGAVRKAEHEVFDLVILDLQLPDITGADVMKRISENGKAPPVVFLTAFPNSTLLHEALEIGSFTLLAKPTKPKELLTVVNRY